MVTWQRGLGGRKLGAVEEEEEGEGERVGRESVIMLLHAMAVCVCVCTVEFVTVFSVALELRALFSNGFNDRYGPFKLWMTQ